MRNFLFAALLAATLPGCNKAESELTSPTDAVEVMLHLRHALTKSGAEDKISTCDIFVFHDAGTYGGQLEAYARFSEGDGVKVSATAGKREIFAVLNMEEHDFSAICTKTDLLATVSRLEENKNGCFHMTGSEKVELKEGSNVVNITVRRLASRVKLNKITRRFSSQALAMQELVIKEVFLSNAVSLFKFSPDYIASENDYVNKLGVAEQKFDPWMRRKIDIVLAQNDSFEEEQVLYTYPNPIALDAEGSPFTARNTKLVVHAVLAGEACYYVIPLGAMKRNNSYEISELVLTRRGTDNPESKTNLVDCEFSVSISPWTVIPMQTENGKYVI